MNCWLLKTEPDKDYSYDDLVSDGRTDWDGVRNYQARNHLRAMETGDLCLIYHSGKQKQVVGVARVTKAAYQDPTTEDDRWVAVEIAPVAALAEPVTLKRIKETPELQSMTIVRHTRLSVSQTTADEFNEVVTRGGRPNLAV